MGEEGSSPVPTRILAANQRIKSVLVIHTTLIERRRYRSIVTPERQIVTSIDIVTATLRSGRTTNRKNPVVAERVGEVSTMTTSAITTIDETKRSFIMSAGLPCEVTTWLEYSNIYSILPCNDACTLDRRALHRVAVASG